MYSDNPYSKLMEQRGNRCVKRYDIKSFVGQDEYVEHVNRELSRYPMPRSLIGYFNQSLCLGAGIACKHFCDANYTTRQKNVESEAYRDSMTPSMTPEKRAVYQVFVLTDTHIENKQREYTRDFIPKIASKITVTLKRKKLKEAAQGPETSADDILKTLSTVYDESIDNHVTVTDEMDDDNTELVCIDEAAATE